jgi:hypothetical protein
MARPAPEVNFCRTVPVTLYDRPKEQEIPTAPKVVLSTTTYVYAQFVPSPVERSLFLPPELEYCWIGTVHPLLFDVN